MHIVENVESKKSTKVQKVPEKKHKTLILLPPREKCLRLQNLV